MKVHRLPYAEHFQQLPCGTRAKYVAVHCRCGECRAANSRYVQERDRIAKVAARELADEAELSLRRLPAGEVGVIPAVRSSCPQTWTAPDGSKRVRHYARACQGINGEPCRYRSHLRKDSSGDVCLRCRPRLASTWNGLVSADAVREHLKTLSAQGVGYKSVAIAADVSKTVLANILFRDQHQLRALAGRRVLAIDRDALADGALVPAGKTWRLLRRLLSEGFTKRELARRLGSESKNPALQFKHTHVKAVTAARVERFYHVVMVGGEPTPRRQTHGQ